MAMVVVCNDTSYIGQACASTICTMRHALMGHCVHSVTLYRLTACSSYAYSMHLQARELYLTYTYTRLYQSTCETANRTGACHQGSKGATEISSGPWVPWQIVGVWRIGAGFWSIVDTCGHH